MDKHRLFFALEAECNWPKDLPHARILQPQHRHLTLAFLGNCDAEKLKVALSHSPLFIRKIGAATHFDKLLFLPEKIPRVVAWHVQENAFFINVKRELENLLRKIHFSFDQKPFLPHVTIARSPFDTPSWKKQFTPVGVIFHKLHLFESLGNLKYSSLWHYSFLEPFQEISHVADRAFLIRGESIQEIYEHAKVALFFDDPLYFTYDLKKEVNNLEEAIIALNEFISVCDEKIGCRYKAVSFTGELKKENSLFSWEMIVDV